MKKIIHFHFDIQHNIGDAAVVYAIQDLLKEKIEMSEYTSRPIFYLTDINFYNFFEKKLSSNTLLKPLSQSKFIINLLVYMMTVSKKIKSSNSNSVISLINKHDLMIIGGGGVYSKWTLPFNRDLVNKIKIPIVIFGAGYNHNSTDKPLSTTDLASMEALNSKAKLCSVRDENTLDLVKVQNKKALLIGDPAIFLKSKKINLNFSQNIKKIGINISCHETHTKKNVDKMINLYVKLIKDLKKNNKIQIYYLMHSVEEVYVIQQIKEQLPDIIICKYGAYEMKYIYENLDLVISMMLHSSIFAYGSDVNFINIAYDVKNFAFMKLINNMDNLIDMQKIEYNSLYSKSLLMLEGKNKVKRHLVKKEKFKQIIDEFMKEIITL